MRPIFLLASILLASSAFADVQMITIKNGDVSTKEIKFEKNKEIEFKIHNLDKDFEEVKSKELNLKIEIPVNAEVTVKLPPMNPGEYFYKVDFKHPETQKRNIKIIECKMIVK